MKTLYITMPQPGETITEGTIVKWLIAEGTVVEEGTPLAELETDKALFEYESPFAGKVTKIIQGDQSRVPVAEPIAVMEVDDKKAEQYIMLGIGMEVDGDEENTQQNVNASSQKEPAASSKSPVAQENVSFKDSDIKLSPYVRKLAREHNLSSAQLMSLANTEGRVTKEAIESFAKSGKAPQASSAPSSQNANQGYDVMPFSPIRMRIAENMTKSKQNIPHAHTGLTVDMTEVLKYRETHKDEFKQKNGVSLSLLTLIQPTLVKAIQAYPAVNASFVGEGNSSEIRIFKAINMSVAVGTESGLMTPVIKDVANLSPVNFAKNMRDVVDRANKKKLLPDDFSGTTFLFNNFGYFGLNMGVQVIQYPLAATLGMGCLEKKVVYIDGGITVRDTANFFLAFDHRVIDGFEAGNFLNAIKDSLEDFSFEV